MFKKQLFSFMLLFSLFLTIYTPITSAHHYRFTTMNPEFSGFPGSGFAGALNYMNYFHVVGNSVSVGTPSAISSNTNAAVNSWKSIVPLKFDIVSEGQGDINISRVADGCGNGSGCYKVTQVISGPSDHNANYVFRAKITLPTDTSGSELTFQIAHELGHGIGLAEAYVDTSPAGGCASFSTVMDSCTRVLPTSNDKNDIEKTYGGLIGGASDITTSWNSNTLQVKWKDNSLGERYYQVEYYKVASTGAETLLYSNNVTKNIGLIKGITTQTGLAISDKTIIDESFSKTNYSSGKYRVKIKPYFAVYSRYGVSTQIDFNF